MILIILIILFFGSPAYCDEAKVDTDNLLKGKIKQEDWFGVLEGVNLGLEKYPDDEAYLNIKADAYWHMFKFKEALEVYDHIVEVYPTEFYKINREKIKAFQAEYLKAQEIIDNIDSNRLDMGDVIPLYLNVMYRQQRIDKSYELIRRFGLQSVALVRADEEDLCLLERGGINGEEQGEMAKACIDGLTRMQIKQAHVFQTQRNMPKAHEIYSEVLNKDPENIDAQMGMGYLKLNERKFREAHKIFEEIYNEHPEYIYAKIGVVNSYIADAQYSKALEILDELPQTKLTDFLRSIIYEEVEMYDSARKAIKNDHSALAHQWRRKLDKKTCPTISPQYSFYDQTLANEYKLDAHKIGFVLQEDLGKNFMGGFGYTGNHFELGSMNGDHYDDYANDINFGLVGRPDRKFSLQGTIGARFINGSNENTPPASILLTDDWITYHPNDNLRLKLGFLRTYLEESFLSTVGVYIAPGVVAGVVSDNKLYIDVEQRLPWRSYAYFKGGGGIRDGEQLPTNPYVEGLLGVGKVVYSNFNNPFINAVAVDLTTYNAGYRYNVLEEFGPSTPFGVYFSPPYFNANSLNFRAEGYLYKFKLRYGVKAFVASQIVIDSNIDTKVGVGVAPYISYAPNDRLTFNAVFHYSNFANIQKYYAMFQLQIKLFRRK